MFVHVHSRMADTSVVDVDGCSRVIVGVEVCASDGSVFRHILVCGLLYISVCAQPVVGVKAGLFWCTSFACCMCESFGDVGAVGNVAGNRESVFDDSTEIKGCLYKQKRGRDSIYT